MTRLAILLGVVILVSGCTSANFSGVKPIYPKVGIPGKPKSVSSLQPTFRWEADGRPNASYDFAIYECIRPKRGFWSLSEDWKKPMMGRQIYYREGLGAPEHRIEESLAPSKEYYWSVRTRVGDKVTAWSTYDYKTGHFSIHEFLLNPHTEWFKQSFIFKTARE